jgi:tetratricopeptide (TPR) repeat protein
MAVFRDVTPTMRIGNLLIYRGTFHIPWIRQEAMLGRARRTLYSPNPDLDEAENYLREILAGDSNNFVANVELGNVMLFRKRPEEAQRSYQSALRLTENESSRQALEVQIGRLSAHETLQNIPSLRIGGE